MTGAVRVPVEPHVVAWRVPVSGPFGAVDRCTDRELCRVRVRENGEEWPILETAERSA